MLGKDSYSSHVKGVFLVPDYYKNFSCKGGSCRNSCCSGWGITISMQQYYTLLGLQCKKTLKGKLDAAFFPVANPTRERYAMIAPNYMGDCPLHMENGYCMLQAHCGEEVLPTICRYYPRGPKTDYALECSCSNSCEKVLEQLLNHDCITFEIKELEFKMAKTETIISAEEQTVYHKVRAFCFDILENRTYPLSTRILMVGKVLIGLDHDRSVDLSSLDLSVSQHIKDVPFTYNIVLNISKWFTENSRSISDYCKDNEAFYSTGDFLANYQDALQHFNEVLPFNEIYFFVNFHFKTRPRILPMSLYRCVESTC
jgi:hypothetical protein